MIQQLLHLALFVALCFGGGYVIGKQSAMLVGSLDELWRLPHDNIAARVSLHKLICNAVLQLIGVFGIASILLARAFILDKPLF